LKIRYLVGNKSYRNTIKRLMTKRRDLIDQILEKVNF
jgi:hypothetical protein